MFPCFDSISYNKYVISYMLCQHNDKIILLHSFCYMLLLDTSTPVFTWLIFSNNVVFQYMCYRLKKTGPRKS
jgi:hypothetical protein